MLGVAPLTACTGAEISGVDLADDLPDSGSVAFWDNRATQHVESNDFLPARRVMERVTVVGGKPF